MLIKTLLNNVERFKSFVYGSGCVILVGGMEALFIDIEPRRNSRLQLRQSENLSEKQPVQASELLKLNLVSIKGYLLREDFHRFC